jgi:hypothetical protein
LLFSWVCISSCLTSILFPLTWWKRCVYEHTHTHTHTHTHPSWNIWLYMWSRIVAMHSGSHLQCQLCGR